jgi:hypothetical protein
MSTPIFQPVDDFGNVINNSPQIRPIENSPQIRPVDNNFNTPVMRPVDQQTMTHTTSSTSTTTNQNMNQNTPQVQVVSQTPQKSGIHMDLIFALIM